MEKPKSLPSDEDDKIIWSMITSNINEDKIPKSNDKNDDSPTNHDPIDETGRLLFKLGGSCSNVSPPSVNQRNSTPSDSFVVINRSPTEEIEASLANLQNVLEKTISVDYNSIISNINPEEIQEKLVEVLQENSKLKETLIRNNEAMKKNFNSLVTWQENVHSLLNHHKTKFSEIRDLVYQLKKENGELKIQIANNLDRSLSCKHYMLDGACQNKVEEILNKNPILEEMTKSSSTIQQTEPTQQEELPSMKVSQTSSNETTDTQVVSVSSTQTAPFDETIIQQINRAIQTSEMQIINQSVDKSVSLMASSLESQYKESISSKKKEDEDKNNGMSVQNGEESSNRVEHEITELQKDIQKFDMPSLSESMSPRKQHLTINVKQYSNQLQTIMDFYMAERTRFRTIQENLLKCEKILSEINQVGNKSSDKANKVIQSGQDKIEELRIQFRQDVVKYSDEVKKLIETQKLYQRIFWDYSSLVSELESTEEDNFKMKTMEDNVKEKDKVLENLTKEYVEKMRILSLKEKELDEEKANVRSMMTHLQHLVEEFHKKFKKLEENTAAINEEREKLKEEKNSLDRQSQLYESKRMSESMENTSLQQKLKEEHQQQLKNFQIIIDDLQKQLANKTSEYESAIVAVKLQMDFYRADFEAERANKDELIKEREKLKENIAVLEQRMSTLNSVARSQNPSVSQNCHICHRFIAPGELHGDNYCAMEFD